MATSNNSLADFVKEVSWHFVASKPESVWQCDAELPRLLESGGIQQWFNAELAALGSDYQHFGNWTAKEVVLHKGQGWTLSIALLDAPHRFIHALSFLAIYVPLTDDLQGERYRLPAGFR